MKTTRTFPFLILALIVSAAPAVGQGRCDVRREVSGRVDAQALGGVLVHAEAGALEVVGVDGGEVRVRGVVCASDDGLAADATLRVEPRRDAAWVEVSLPDADGWGDDYVRMDLVVEMPRRLAVDIRDSSGDLVVRSVAAARVNDSSGELVVEDVEGEVEIEDSSGEIRVRNTGPVTVDDSSGEIDVQEVRGSVHVLDDGSGGIEIRDVEGDVRVVEDGSGSIRVENVGGDFVVERDGSGSVTYRDVRGTVRVPDRR